MQNAPQERRRSGETLAGSRRRDSDGAEEMEGYCRRNGSKAGGQVQEVEKESMMMELTRLVQKTVKESSWWERRGVDCSILAAAFLCLPLGKNLHTHTRARGR